MEEIDLKIKESINELDKVVFPRFYHHKIMATLFIIKYKIVLIGTAIIGSWFAYGISETLSQMNTLESSTAFSDLIDAFEPTTDFLNATMSALVDYLPMEPIVLTSLSLVAFGFFIPFALSNRSLIKKAYI